MSVAITGTTVSTLSLNAIDAQLYSSNGFCTDSTHGYVIGTNFSLAGSLYKCPLSNWSAANATQVYGAGFLGTGSVGCWISGGKIYSIEAAGSSRILSANIDGSSGSATVEWSSTTFTSSAPCSIYLDGSDVLAASGMFRYLARLNLASDAIERVLDFTWFCCGVGPCRFQSNSLLVGIQNPGYLGIWKKDTGHLRLIAGNGTDSAISAGGAFSVPIANIHWPSSDEDGRVYFVSNSRLWRLEGGTITQVGSASGITQMQHVFASNRIIAGNGNDFVMYS